MTDLSNSPIMVDGIVSGSAISLSAVAAVLSSAGAPKGRYLIGFAGQVDDADYNAQLTWESTARHSPNGRRRS